MCEWITFKTYQKRSNSHSKCATANVFYVYHRKPCIETHTVFKAACNYCKSVLENAELSYAHLVQARIDNERLGFCQF